VATLGLDPLPSMDEGDRSVGDVALVQRAPHAVFRLDDLERFGEEVRRDDHAAAVEPERVADEVAVGARARHPQ
jgi:hypothetical protein